MRTTICASVLGVWVSATLAADRNFACRDPELTAVAEQSRSNSARFWTSRDLPGDWSRPCPIIVRPAAHAGGGATSFIFDRGEVSGWSMTISGRRERLLADVLPHEVDHMVRASLVRRPIPRWLDEGCATLMESPESHQQFRQQLARYLDQPLDAAFLDAADYPNDAREVERLYTVGFSVVEFLLERRDAATLLALQSDVRPPSHAIVDRYGSDVQQLDREWREWAVRRAELGDSCSQVNCPCHRSPAATTAALLTVYTSQWCTPCRAFWSDFESDEEFRRALENNFRIARVDVDQQPLAARLQQIENVPVFVSPRGRVLGYQGKDWLREQLQIASPESARSQTPVPAPTPSPVPAAALAGQPADKSENHRDGWLKTTWNFTWDIVPRLWPWLEWAGIISGSAASGGVGAIAIAAVLGLVRRRRARRRTRSPPAAAGPSVAEGGAAPRPAPFPRRLDEARQLLELRQSEGRVAVLDALRGMFLEDELDRSLASAEPAAADTLNRLRHAIDARVAEAAPLTVTLSD